MIAHELRMCCLYCVGVNHMIMVQTTHKLVNRQIKLLVLANGNVTWFLAVASNIFSLRANNFFEAKLQWFKVKSHDNLKRSPADPASREGITIPAVSPVTSLASEVRDRRPRSQGTTTTASHPPSTALHAYDAFSCYILRRAQAQAQPNSTPSSSS